MTQKSFAKLQRSRPAATKNIAPGRDASIPRLQFQSVPNRIPADPLPLTLAWGTPDQVDSDEPPPCKPAAKTAFPSARCSIVAAAFHGAKGIGLA